MQSVVACIQIRDLKTPSEGSREGICIECRGRVWVSPAAVAVLRERECDIVCLECVADAAATGGKNYMVQIYGESVGEMKRFLKETKDEP